VFTAMVARSYHATVTHAAASSSLPSPMMMWSNSGTLSTSPAAA
jgi:hypothetical protein